MKTHHSAVFLVVTGRPYIKKNNQKVVRVGGTTRVIYSKNYRAWEKSAMNEISGQISTDFVTIDYPVNMRCIFCFENHQAEPDLSALYEGIQDVLQKLKVIDNDRLIMGHNGSTKHFGVEPRTIVELSAWKPDDDFYHLLAKGSSGRV